VEVVGLEEQVVLEALEVAVLQEILVLLELQTWAQVAEVLLAYLERLMVVQVALV
jgi:hypothetical protein